MPPSNILQVPDYETYLVMERPELLTRYVCVERDLGNAKIEWAQMVADEKAHKANAWEAEIRKGASVSAADRTADYRTFHIAGEIVQARVKIDVLEREAALLLLLMRGPNVAS